VSATIAVANLSLPPVLQHVSLTAGPGEVVALVGSQGSGKTTLLKVLAGLCQAESGQATDNGIDCRSAEVRRAVGVMGEAWGLMPLLTVWENLQLFGRLWGVRDARLTEVLKWTDMLPLRDALAGKLGAGEAARLGLARALLHDPPVLLLDEPIGDVDRESSSLIGFAISEAADRGKSVLLATFGHPRSVALANRLVYMEDGRILEPA
jgi:ABC-type multidrug transport system ATPase subunit